MTDTLWDVCGIGNAMVDIVCDVSDAFLEENRLTRGAMLLIDRAQAEELQCLVKPNVQCSGGSAANTMAGLACLGARVAYIGKVRDDEMGKIFVKDIRTAGVDFDVPPAEQGPATGRCLVFVTADAERTMQTYLGASATLGPADIDPRTIEASGIVYLEGYLWDPEPAKQAFLKAAAIAHSAGRRVSLSLSDSFCVDRHREEFLELVADHVDVLFANEDEIISLFQVAGLEEALEALAGQCETAVITCGSRGSVVIDSNKRDVVAAESAENVVDTTGAGDMFASGFLYGLSRGLSPAECGRLGGQVAAEIICQFGARPQNELRHLVD